MAIAGVQEKVSQAILSLGGDPGIVEARGLPCYDDANGLVVADISQSGIKHQLMPEAARAWNAMKAAAADDDVSLILLSGFRSFERQFEIIRKRKNSGESLDSILSALAPPGCSQHHTGRAIDIGTLGCAPASETFADTSAFLWLSARASKYGFTMSYPENNPFGYLYEPWHWYMADADSG